MRISRHLGMCGSDLAGNAGRTSAFDAFPSAAPVTNPEWDAKFLFNIGLAFRSALR